MKHTQLQLCPNAKQENQKLAGKLYRTNQAVLIPQEQYPLPLVNAMGFCSLPIYQLGAVGFCLLPIYQPGAVQVIERMHTRLLIYIQKYQTVSYKRIIRFNIQIYYGGLYTLDINPARYAPLSSLSAPDNMNCRTKHCKIKSLKNKTGQKHNLFRLQEAKQKTKEKITTKENSERPDQAQIQQPIQEVYGGWLCIGCQSAKEQTRKS